MAKFAAHEKTVSASQGLRQDADVGAVSMALVHRLDHQYGLPAGVINTQRLHRHEIGTRALGDRLLQRLAWPTQQLARYQMKTSQLSAFGWGHDRFQRREVMPTLGDLGWGQPHRSAIAEIRRSKMPALDRSDFSPDLSHSPDRSPVPSWVPSGRGSPETETSPASVVVRQPASPPEATSPQQVQVSPKSSASAAISVPAATSDVSQPVTGNTFRVQRRADIQLSPGAPPASISSPPLPQVSALQLPHAPPESNGGAPADAAIYRAVITNPLTTEAPGLELSRDKSSPLVAPTNSMALLGGPDSEPASAVSSAGADQPLAPLSLATPLAGVAAPAFPSLVQRYTLTDVIASSPRPDTAPMPLVRPLIQRRLRHGDLAQAYPLGTVLMDGGAKAQAATALSLRSPTELVLPLPPQASEPISGLAARRSGLDAEAVVVRPLAGDRRSQNPAQPLTTANHLQALPLPQPSISRLPRSPSPLPTSPVAETVLPPLPWARGESARGTQMVQRQESDGSERVASETISGMASPAPPEQSLPSAPVDAEDMADQVSRILSRQLAVERERRGLER